ncbi:hypothetical protein J1N09_07860 [Aureitalea sp. L0-47]|uniref:hypothetical protein n=1 Tax=Aureitalea sp. L0-47 TaxID=2816962 RepID=UPI002238DAC0|nr:hypothetical protein [Aureitalea sp. L0-47]MCW5519750.1 hypothetical protein [Aureitalea sp. L0-47]
MRARAYWRFYRELLPVIAGFTMINIALFGLMWSYVLCVTLGTLLGYLGFVYFKSDQFYFYHNLGLTKWRLFEMSFTINGIVALVVLSCLKLLSSLLFVNI